MQEYTPTPDFYNDYICHYGVKGMKWHYHKPKVGENASAAYKRVGSMSDKEYNDILSRIKLTKSSKGGKSAASKEKATKGSSEKKASSGKGSAEKKESTKAEKTATEKQTRTTNEKVIYRQQVDPEYTKWLEKRQAKVNESKLDTDQVKERMAEAEARRKRKGMNIKKVYSRRSS